MRVDWRIWTSEASLLVDDPDALDAARAIVDRTLSAVDEACSRFRDDSELSLLATRPASGARVSPLLASLVARAIEAARMTDGAVDPTLGGELEALGYDRDLRFDPGSPDLPVEPSGIARRPRWQEVVVEGDLLTVPAGVTLDLGATAKAVAADLAVSRVAAQLGCGVLLSLGGDIATAFRAPEGGWPVLVRDREGDPEETTALSAGSAMATSSTQRRRWSSGGFGRHHILDPATGLPAEPVWKTVTVVAPSCFEANTLSTAAVVLGRSAIEWLERLGASARLVDAGDGVRTVGDWPLPGTVVGG